MLTFCLVIAGIFWGMVFGYYVGHNLCKKVLVKRIEQMVLDFLNEEVDRRGLIAFSDSKLSIHFLDKHDFDILMDKMLRHYHPSRDREM